jgi:hypothetical protein
MEERQLPATTSFIRWPLHDSIIKVEHDGYLLKLFIDDKMVMWVAAPTTKDSKKGD